MTGPVVTVVTVTFSPGETLPVFLDSLAGASVDPVPVVLADNGSNDGSVEAAALRPGVRLLRTGKNLGYGGGANVGVAATDTEFALVANPDLVWHAGAVDVLLDAAARHPEAVAFGPRILTVDGEVYPSARELPSLSRGTGHALFGWWWPGNPWTRAYRREGEGLAERPAGWLSGSCLLVRRAAWDAVGGFDPRYFMYFEDIDLGERLSRIGPNLYVPDAVVMHLGGHSTSRDPRAMARAHHDSAWRYLSHRYAGARWWPVRVLLRVGLAARAALAGRVEAVASGARLAGSGGTDARPAAAPDRARPAPPVQKERP